MANSWNQRRGAYIKQVVCHPPPKPAPSTANKGKITQNWERSIYGSTLRLTIDTDSNDPCSVRLQFTTPMIDTPQLQYLDVDSYYNNLFFADDYEGSGYPPCHVAIDVVWYDGLTTHVTD